VLEWLTAMETESCRFQEETVEQLMEVEQDVDRAASDGKFHLQHLTKVEVQAQASYQQSTATQAQVEGLRQQTDTITKTMRSFDKNVTHMNEFLEGLITRLERMCFD